MDVASKKIKNRSSKKSREKRNYRSLIISLLLVLITIFNLGNTIYLQKKQYLSNYWYKFSTLKQTYLDSQYVNKHPKGWVPDEFVNAYNAGELTKGTNPVLIIPDTPPLGKYLIGLSILVFNNENIISLICGLLSVLLMYLVGRQIYAHTITALLPIFFLSFEPIFNNQFVYTPLFDIIQLVFLLASLYFFNKGFLSKKKYHIFFVLSSILLGCFISTKFFATGITIIAAYYIILLVHKDKKRLIALTVSAPLAIIILLLSYVRVLAFDKNLHTFIGIQKWVFLYHKSQLILPFTIWPLILFNKWYVWYGNQPIISDPQWRITWPIGLIGTIITIAFYVRKKIPHKKEVEVLMAWSVFYILFFSIGQITTRYLIIYIPVLYMITFYGIECAINKLKK